MIAAVNWGAQDQMAARCSRNRLSSGAGRPDEDEHLQPGVASLATATSSHQICFPGEAPV